MDALRCTLETVSFANLVGVTENSEDGVPSLRTPDLTRMVDR